MFCPGFASASTTRPFHSAATNAGTQAMQASNAGEQANVRGQEPASRGLHLHACTCTCDARKRSRHSRKQSQHGGNQTPRRLGSRHEVCHEHRQHRGQAPTTGALACSGCSPCAQVGKRARVRGVAGRCSGDLAMVFSNWVNPQTLRLKFTSFSDPTTN